ncbi:MAG: DUF1513 domain-containing protein [Bdellovibrionota bacterium]
MLLSRRNFLRASALLTLDSMLSGCTSAGLKTLFPASEQKLVTSDASGTILISNLDGKYQKRISTSLSAAHGYLTFGRRSQLLVIEKTGASMALVDIEEGRLLEQIPAGTGRNFYGHGAWSKGLNLYYTTEASTQPADNMGVIVVRDPKSLKPVGEFSSFGFFPHDLHVFEEEGLIAVCNAGSDHGSVSNIVFFDLKTGEKKREIYAEREDVVFGHFSAVGLNSIAVSTQGNFFKDLEEIKRMRLQAYLSKSQAEKDAAHAKEESLKFPLATPTYIVSSAGKVEALDAEGFFPDSIGGFSVEANGQFIAVSHGPTHHVAFYNQQTRKLAAAVKFPAHLMPSAIAAISNGDFVVGCLDGSVWKVSVPGFSLGKLFQGVHSAHAIWV